MSSFLPFIVLGLVSGSVYGLAAAGLVVTYRTSGVFNFAHGAVAAVGAYLFFQLRQLDHVPWPIALFLSVVVGGIVMGIILEVMARRLSSAALVSRVVATVGLLILLQQLAILHYGPVTRQFDGFLPTRSFRLAGANVGFDQLVVFLLGLGGTAGLSLLLRSTRTGRAMRGVVDNPDLISLTGARPATIRRQSWVIGSMFASLSGILIAPSIGLDAGVLTLLVVQAFGAASIGLFTSLPLAYAGGLILGIGSSFSSKYVGSIPFLNGLPSSLPFVVLFLLLVAVPRRRLVEITSEQKGMPLRTATTPRAVRTIATLVGAAILCVAPDIVGTRLIAWSAGLAYAIIMLSLVLLTRMSGQLSLCQLTFAAVGGAAFSHLVHPLGWLPAVLVGALVTLPLGLVLAVPAIRLSGLYLALASLGFGLLMQSMFYGQGFLFGSNDSIDSPRPSFARSDHAYYYVVLIFAAVAAALYVGIKRSPLGRLLRALADSPTALATGGMNVSLIRVAAFCISAFMAGLGGALLGPVTGTLSSTPLVTVQSLLLVVVIALQAPFGDVAAAGVAAIAMTVVPSYLVDHQSIVNWLPVVFGGSAILISTRRARADNAPDSFGSLTAGIVARETAARRSRAAWQDRLVPRRPVSIMARNRVTALEAR